MKPFIHSYLALFHKLRRENETLLRSLPPYLPSRKDAKTRKKEEKGPVKRPFSSRSRCWGGYTRLEPTLSRSSALRHHTSIIQSFPDRQYFTANVIVVVYGLGDFIHAINDRGVIAPAQ